MNILQFLRDPRGLDERRKPKRRRRRRFSFDAAQGGRLFADWSPAESLNDIIQSSHSTLRKRARDLAINNPIVVRYLQLLTDGVIGPAGINLRSKAENAEEVEAAWSEWVQNVTPARQSWREFLHVALQTLAIDGEIYIELIQNRGKLVLRMWSADYLENYSNTNRTPSIKNGIVYNDLGEELGYYLSIDNKRVYFPAASMLHVYKQLIPSQLRGYSWLAPVMVGLRHLDKYQEAELVAARTAAAQMGFVIPSADQVEEYIADDQEDTDDSDELISEVEPGTIEQLPPGASFEEFTPPHPNSNFKTFSQAVLQSLAGALGVSYHALANDLSSANYSSLRAGTLVERDCYRTLRAFVCERICDPIFETFCKLNKFDTPHAWTPRRWEWLDPLKDVQAKVAELNAGLTSRTRLVAADGEEWEEIAAELQNEKTMLEGTNVQNK